MSGMVWSRHSLQAVQQHNDHGDHTISLEVQHTSTHLQGKGRHPRVQELQRDQAPDAHLQDIWERVLGRRVIECTDIHESQFGFMPGRSTTDTIFILKQTIEQCREGQKGICVTFIDL